MNISTEQHSASVQGTKLNRNDNKRQNSTSSREKGSNIRAPITDIRQKKQAATINVDDLSATAIRLDSTQVHLSTIRQGPTGN